ncbi:methionine ABC transporter ATP-binding protein [Cellulosilyticum ruminicola]|uniref:methionine ABC transporter ATP-binding protein n=1 Tax=Cellulosilyticum ruminicola TaxID=425254 RepID=UPI000AE65515|nr:ATP-binding cassette domain-containing protein [Cellulosilyticum ruminicola]
MNISEPIIALKNITKIYESDQGKFTALSGVNLEIYKGEIYGIIGMSGAGKSTLVRCINYLERPTEGQVLFDGKSLATLSDGQLRLARQSMSMIFQQFNLLMQRTALQNVCFPMEIAGIKKREAKKRAKELLELVGLGDKLDAYPSQLSGGQKQRIAIARALATNPKVLLCDEATSALDPSTTQAILALLKEINEKLGITIVIITHEMKVVEQICTHVAIIAESKIAEVGTVKEVFTHPKSKVGEKLVYPNGIPDEKLIGKRCCRIVFDGTSAYDPAIASMILECQVPVNIMYADMKRVGDKALGQMVIQLPENEQLANKVIQNLKDRQLVVEEVYDYVG